MIFFFFFFQAEDGIRDVAVTGVQTCALPISRYNPKVRYFPSLNENMSLAKTIPIHERLQIDFRAEAFNIFNRVRFGTGATQLQDRKSTRLNSSHGYISYAVFCLK